MKITNDQLNQIIPLHQKGLTNLQIASSIIPPMKLSTLNYYIKKLTKAKLLKRKKPTGRPPRDMSFLNVKEILGQDLPAPIAPSNPLGQESPSDLTSR